MFSQIFSRFQDIFLKVLNLKSFLFQIIFWDSNTYEKLDTLPSLGGFVYSATCSMVDPHAVAFGVGDNTIRIWNTRSKGKAYDITQVWQGLKSKITSVSYNFLLL